MFLHAGDQSLIPVTTDSQALIDMNPKLSKEKQSSLTTHVLNFRPPSIGVVFNRKNDLKEECTYYSLSALRHFIIIITHVSIEFEWIC